jgi:GNAT superfamily N-acetyltransferase
MSDVTIRPLASVVELVPTIQSWFESEWPAYYGAGRPGDARHDLLSYANVGTLPLGLVAFHEGKPCGFAALKTEPFASHPHLGPWAGAAYVQPPLRRRGIGRSLVAALEAEAAALGCARIYCATATSASLLERCGWQLLEMVIHEGTTVGVYEKAL